MIKKILVIFITITLTSCASIKENIPKLERQASTDDKAKTLSDVFCKK